MGFEQDVKPLFREMDRASMDFLFDLWSYEDAKKNAEGILERLENKTMPCDHDWPESQIAVVRRWVEDGCPP